jgi:hypothetical protein
MHCLDLRNQLGAEPKAEAGITYLTQRKKGIIHEKPESQKRVMTVQMSFPPPLIFHPVSEDTLLPCPFCGVLPDFREWSSEQWTVEVTCLNKTCAVRPHTPLCRSRDDARAIWNTRTP